MALYTKKGQRSIYIYRQSHKNDVANEAWAYEKQSDSLYVEAKELKEKADNNTNDVEKMSSDKDKEDEDKMDVDKK